MMKKSILLAAILCCGIYAKGAETTTVHDTIVLECEDWERQLVLASTANASDSADIYDWSNGESTRAIKLPKYTSEGEFTYRCDAYKTVVYGENNLMANGDFESNPPQGFESDYDYAGFDPNPLFGPGGTHNDKSGLYVITSSAKRASHSFADVLPHSGNYFALFDANKSGDAWRATSAINSALSVKKDSTYYFSYWAANVNTTAENGHPAVLQFRISTDGGLTYTDLGTPFTPTSDNKWCYNSVTYKANITSNSVVISVRDLTTYKGVGNDFGLDDIMFQEVSYVKKQLVRTDIYPVRVEACKEDPEPDPDPEPEPEPKPEPEDPCVGGIVWAKWNDVLFVDNTADEYVDYQWYKDSVAVADATGQYYRDLEVTAGAGYYVVVTKKDGSKIHTCEVTFDNCPRSAAQSHKQASIVETQVYYMTDIFRIVKVIYDDESTEVKKELLRK